MEEPKNENRVNHIETNSKINQNGSHADSFVNYDLTSTVKVDSAPKIDYHKNFDIGERKAKFPVTDKTKSENGMKVRDYPAHPPDRLDSSYMAVAVGVLLTVIIILIVAIVFILHKNYQYEKKNCLKTVQYDNYNEPDSVLLSGQPQTIL
jgi:hypothetical protein